ncbi:maleate cis-trans isomerase family protein [Amphritea sp. HPY]|uniref:maleate cis-trans isomerase family protein n=1 Tax=Amphritea sp. HPY TaxID=3421652 RepID=UPI003D7E839C
MSRPTDKFKTLEKSYPCDHLSHRARVRIGLVQLATDYTLENDWHQLVGDEVELYSTRMPYSSEINPTVLRSMENDIGTAAALVAPGQELDVMAYGCTAASMLIGDAQIAAQLTQQRPGLPATNPWNACKAALHHLQAKRIAVLTPYTSDVNLPLFEALEQEGFNVAAFGAFQLTKDTEIPSVHPTSIEAAVKDLLANTQVDAVFLSCTNLRAMQILDKLEQQFGLPMVSSNQAMFWHALRLADSQLTFTGFGRLLA